MHIFQILGILLTWYGIWLYQSIEESKFDHGEELGGILIIILGVTVFCVAIYGIVVAVMEQKKMLIYVSQKWNNSYCIFSYINVFFKQFAVLLVVLIVIQLIMVSISHIIINNSISEKLKEGFDELMDTKYQKPNSTLSIYEERVSTQWNINVILFYL